MFYVLSSSPNAVLRLRFNHFATECSWDHTYVYDGDSIYAPLVAVFRSVIILYVDTCLLSSMRVTLHA